MKKRFLFFLIISSNYLFSQSMIDNYIIKIDSTRNQIKLDMLNSSRPPISISDSAFLQYYPANIQWKLEAKITLTPNEIPFELPTSSGKTKLFKKYAVARMAIQGQEFELSIYQNQAFLNNPELMDHLFIPFLDATNGETTYEGGRYIDINISDISSVKATIDFNLCYNPYCAYSSGYNCPIPPAENRLKIPINAGEKKWTKGDH
jgi:uncharacterized protein